MKKIASQRQVSLTEAELVERLLTQEEAAYVLVVRMYHASMLRFARSLVGTTLAEEVVQDTWLALLKSLPGFEGRSSLKTWIFSILGNLAKSRLRSESHRIAIDPAAYPDDPTVHEERFDADGRWLLPPIPWHAETPEALLNAEQLGLCLEQVLARLPPLQQAVLTLRDREGLKMEDICNILTLSATNGRVLLHRARVSLHSAIERYERDEEC